MLALHGHRKQDFLETSADSAFAGLPPNELDISALVGDAESCGAIAGCSYHTPAIPHKSHILRERASID